MSEALRPSRSATTARFRASNPEHMDARRAAIVAATARVIVTNGVDSTRLADVAEEAGVSVGLIQHYFRTKDRLVLETFRASAEQSRDGWRRCVAEDDEPLVRIARLARFIVTDEDFDMAWGLWVEFYAASTRNRELRKNIHRIMNLWRTLFTECINDGIARGVLQSNGNVDDAVTRIVALTDGLAIQTLLGLYEMTVPLMESMILDAIADLFKVDRAALAKASQSMAHPPLPA
ncbi:TetR/AcrR family transcriptional regulator [Mycolicibacterium brisbanense]|nr:TetR/AcrR family transcriptional regulator [Mycolicibacterium brisbanense]MCV7159070.1 TetR family transcriptional regulator C-terminal domain-containing protein [Mycolicibacterium brisbanense]